MADDPNAVADASAPTDAPVAPLEAPAIDPAAERAARIEAAVRRWQIDSLGNSPVSRSSDAWAHVAASLPVLIDTIIKEA